MQLSNVMSQPLVERTVYGSTRCLAFRSPSRRILEVLSIIGLRRVAPGYSTPFTRSVERARESREQVRLQHDFLYPLRSANTGGVRERFAQLRLAAGTDVAGQSDERVRLGVQRGWRHHGSTTRRRIRHPRIEHRIRLLRHVRTTLPRDLRSTRQALSANSSPTTSPRVFRMRVRAYSARRGDMRSGSAPRYPSIRRTAGYW